jgi:hypothetical protein
MFLRAIRLLLILAFFLTAGLYLAHQASAAATTSPAAAFTDAPFSPDSGDPAQHAADKQKIVRLLDGMAVAVILLSGYLLIYRRRQFKPHLAPACKVMTAAYIYWVILLLYTNSLEFAGALSWAGAFHALGAQAFEWTLQEADNARFMILGIAPVFGWIAWSLKTGHRCGK